jgi:hypothetical protein
MARGGGINKLNADHSYGGPYGGAGAAGGTGTGVRPQHADVRAESPAVHPRRASAPSACSRRLLLVPPLQTDRHPEGERGAPLFRPHIDPFTTRP